MVATVAINLNLAQLIGIGRDTLYAILEEEGYRWQSGHMPGDPTTPFGEDDVINIYNIDTLKLAPNGILTRGGWVAPDNINLTFLNDMRLPYVQYREELY